MRGGFTLFIVPLSLPSSNSKIGTAAEIRATIAIPLSGPETFTRNRKSFWERDGKFCIFMIFLLCVHRLFWSFGFEIEFSKDASQESILGAPVSHAMTKGERDPDGRSPGLNLLLD